MELRIYSAHLQQDFADVPALLHHPVGGGSVGQREYMVDDDCHFAALQPRPDVRAQVAGDGGFFLDATAAMNRRWAFCTAPPNTCRFCKACADRPRYGKQKALSRSWDDWDQAP